MKRWTAVLFILGLGCGHGEKRPADELAAGANQPGWRPGTGPQDSSRSNFKVDYELGVVETSEVENAIAGHFDDMKACYRQAGKAQRYAGGRVLLRFIINANGKTDDVLVAESDLGNYRVERCLVHVGRSIAFKAPDGHKATTFDYPLEFRASGRPPVLNLDGLKVEHDVSLQLHQLRTCGRRASGPVAAIFYIEPGGLVGSVGLAGGAPLDEDTGDCIVHAIRRWHMSARLPGHVLRCNFNIPPVIASADPPGRSSPRAARRRRR